MCEKRKYKNREEKRRKEGLGICREEISEEKKKENRLKGKE